MRRVVTTYALHRSASGRLSSGVDSSEPDKLRGKVTQMQNVPRGVRDIIVAEPSYDLIQADWAAVEWCIFMWFAGNVERDGFHHGLLDKFQAGEFDPHRYLASFANDVPEAEVTDAMRKEAKPYTYGKLYLGSDRTLARNAGHNDATGIRVGAAHERAFRCNPTQQAILAECKKKRYVQTPLGWRRYFWSWDPKPTEVIATKVSGTAADLCKVVLGTIFAQLPERWEVLSSTHDSALFMAPKLPEPITPDPRVNWVRGMMEQKISWLDGRGFRCDVKVGPNWRSVS